MPCGSCRFLQTPSYKPNQRLGIGNVFGAPHYIPSTSYLSVTVMGSSVHFDFNPPQGYTTNFSTFLPYGLFWNYRSLLSSYADIAFTGGVEADE